MQLPTDYTVHPHLVPVAKRLRGENINAVLRAGVLRIAAGAFGLDLGTENLDCSGLGLGASYVTAVGVVADSDMC